MYNWAFPDVVISLFEILYNLNTSSVATITVDCDTHWHNAQDVTASCFGRRHLCKSRDSLRYLYVPLLSAGSYHRVRSKVPLHHSPLHTEMMSMLRYLWETPVSCSVKLECSSVWVTDMNFTLHSRNPDCTRSLSQFLITSRVVHFLIFFFPGHESQPGRVWFIQTLNKQWVSVHEHEWVKDSKESNSSAFFPCTAS